MPLDHYTESAYLLYPFFPGDCPDPDRDRIAADTLRRAAEHDIERSYADTEGRCHYKRAWAWFFPTVTKLRLGQRTEGWAALEECLRLFSKPNGLFAHNPAIEADPRITETNIARIPKAKLRHSDGVLSPLSEFLSYDAGPAVSLNPNVRRWVTPVSEGNGAFLFAATETLLQSHDGLIRLFPAVPANFTGQFHRLLAVGAFEVSAEMKKGKVLWFQIKSLAGGTVRIVNPWRTIPKAAHPAAIAGKTANGAAILGIRLRRGASWFLRHAG